MHDALGIGVRPKAMSTRFEVRSQLAVVVDLAIEDDPNGFIFIGQRLMTGAQIDDRQPPKSQCRSRTTRLPTSHLASFQGPEPI
jgi:hypothetical protein